MEVLQRAQNSRWLASARNGPQTLDERIGSALVNQKQTIIFIRIFSVSKKSSIVAS